MSTSRADEPASRPQAGDGTAGEVFLAFLKLGLTSFGGPVAHLGYFREELVKRRGWLGDDAYANLVALCQFLPGPASSQVGMAIGLMRAGPTGMAAAWLGFTLPSAALMIAFALAVQNSGAADLGRAGWLAGLKIAAVAVVADAVLGMARQLCPDRTRRAIALLVAAAVTLVAGPLAQIGVIAAGALVGLALLKSDRAPLARDFHESHMPRRLPAALAFVVFLLLLIALPALAGVISDPALSLVDTFYRAGSLVFGGGHVVLPLLEAELVRPDGLTRDTFLAGYGAAQAVPGPLFTLVAYAGAMMPVPPNGIAGGLLALAAIFLPSALLLYAAIPFWSRLSSRPKVASAMMGVNAAVVGIPQRMRDDARPHACPLLYGIRLAAVEGLALPNLDRGLVAAAAERNV